MNKKHFTLLLAAALAGSTLFTSCIGSFGLTNKLLTWNRSLDSKFVNELVFVAFWIIPVYEVSALADLLVINSIEFWSGSNPVAHAGSVKKVDGNDGTYLVETKADGYHISKEGAADAGVDLVYDAGEQSWHVEANGESHKLLKFEAEDEVVMYLPDGQEMNVALSEAGLMAFRQAAGSYGCYAAR